MPGNDTLEIFNVLVLVLMHLSGGGSMHMNPGNNFEPKRTRTLALLSFNCIFDVLRLEQQLELKDSESIFLIENK